MNFIDRRATVLYNKQNVDVLQRPILNHDGFQVVHEQLTDIDLVTVDEVAVYRTPSTNRYKLLRKWLNKNHDTRLWLMTGTPTPNDPTDAWTLAKMVRTHMAKTYTAFKTIMRNRQRKWLPRPSELANMYYNHQ